MYMYTKWNAQATGHHRKDKFQYPCAMSCGGNIVTLLWFRPCMPPCVRVSHFHLVNTMQSKPSLDLLSNLQDMFTRIRG